MSKILAVVKFNHGEAFVLDRKPDLKYMRRGSTIVGSDGVFLKCYYYDSPSPRWQAFGGREFDIKLVDGTVVKCYGQWWSGVTDIARDMAGDEIVHVTACNVDELRGCYVFVGYEGVKTEIEKLRAAYDGSVFGYWEYENILKGR